MVLEFNGKFLVFSGMQLKGKTQKLTFKHLRLKFNFNNNLESQLKVKLKELKASKSLDITN